MSLNPEKAKQADAELKLGNEAISTGFFKWKPDYLQAQPHFEQAGRLYKQAGMMESAMKAWTSSADCHYKMGNLKGAAIVYQNMAQEVQSGAGGKDNSNKVKAGKLLMQAAEFYIEEGDPVRGSDLLLRGGKLLEALDRKDAAQAYDRAAALFDGLPEKDVYAVEPLRKTLLAQLELQRYASAMTTLNRMVDLFSRLQQPHNVYKTLLGRVVVLLGSGDPVAAQREYESRFDVAGFVESAEASAAEDIINCYTEMNAAAMKSTVERGVFNHLDHSIARIAKGLPAALSSGSGTSIKSSNDDEHASKAVEHLLSGSGAGSGPAGMRVIGSAGAAGGAGSSAATEAARSKQWESDKQRAALFARPSAAKAGAAETAAAAPVAAPTAAAGASKQAGKLQSSDGEDIHTSGFDYDAAMAELSAGIAGMEKDGAVEGGSGEALDLAALHGLHGAGAASSGGAEEQKGVPAHEAAAVTHEHAEAAAAAAATGADAGAGAGEGEFDLT